MLFISCYKTLRVRLRFHTGNLVLSIHINGATRVFGPSQVYRQGMRLNSKLFLDKNQAYIYMLHIYVFLITVVCHSELISLEYVH